MMHRLLHNKQKRARYRDTFLRTPAPVADLSYAERVRNELTLRTTEDAVIFRLPSEITEKVFKLVQIQDGFDVKPNRWCWLTITHVCKLWREIAIGTQDLWTHIDIKSLSGPEQTATYLTRSGTSQLIVHFESDEEIPLQCLFLTLKHIDRIRELYIWHVWEAPCIEEIKLSLCQRTAPVLQKFVFQTDFMEYIDARTLLMGNAPNLTELRLALKSPSWANIPIMQNLKHLEIGSSLDFRTALSILSENPNIESVSMTFLKGAPRTNAYILAPIKLSSLTDLDIIADYDALQKFLRSIVTPNLLGWSIRCKTYPVTLDPGANPKSIYPLVYADKECESLILKISPMSTTITANDSSEVKEEQDYNNYSQRWLTYSRNDKENEENYFAIPLVVELDHVCSVIEGSFWCSQATKALTVDISLTGPYTFDLYTSEDLGRYAWMRLLLLLPALQELTIQLIGYEYRIPEADSHRGILEALRSTFIDDDGSTRLISSQLTELRIIGIDLDDGLPYLVESLSSRAIHGNRLRKLLLSRAFGVTELALHVLNQRELVDEIELDDMPLGYS